MADANASVTTQRELPSAEQCQQQVHRIVHSATFRNALTLQQLLQFLADKAVSGSTEGLKEYTIGVEAFGRKQDFDPKIDTIVRVQIHRLRQKLKEYYDAEGTHDPILVAIPKGHYLPSFDLFSVPTPEFHQDSASQPDTPVSGANRFTQHDDAPSASPKKRHRFSRLFSSRTTLAAAAIVMFAAGFWIGSRQLRNSNRATAAASTAELAADKPANPVKIFWANFLGNDPAPVIGYPDAVFLLDDSNDLFRFRQGAIDNRGARVDPHLARQFASNPELVAKAGQLYYESGYTGIGELEGAAMLASLFGQMGLKATIKSSRDITPDDLKQHNVILLGSPFQNIAVAQLFTRGDFTFENADSRREQWRARILNAHPLANESSSYHTERDPATQILKADYSLISIQPGVVPGRYIAILGGLDTTGTEGATLFATSRHGIEQLSKALATSGISGARGEIPVFQALLRIRLEKGYQVLETNLLAVHKLHPQNAGGTEDAAPRPSAR